MSKTTVHFSLTTFATRITEWAAARADVNAMHRILREHAPKLTTKTAKVECDTIVVAALAKRYGVKATVAEKNGRLSGLTFAKSQYADDPKMFALYARAAEALNAARNRFIDPKIVVPTTPVERAKETMVKMLNSDEFHAEAVRAVKALMLLVKA